MTMRILLMNQFFPPDAAPTGELLADVAERLADEGWEVRVVCGRSAYAADGQREVAQVRVSRAAALPFGRGRVARVLSYGSFLAAALYRGLTGPRPDVVLTMTTPPLLCLVGRAVQALRRSRHVMWEMDLYPDVAVGLGVVQPGAWSAQALGALADACRRRADAIIVLGDCMRRRLAGHGIPEEKIEVADNWADGERIRPLGKQPSGTLNVLYAGNLGLPHDTETIQRVMEELREDRRFRFTFSGGGSRRAALEAFCRERGLRNVEFLPYCGRDQQAELLGRADVGLVTQLPGSLGCLVPSKIYGLMAAGKPVLFIGPREAHAAGVILREECGWQAECGDWKTVIALLRELAERPGLLQRAGHKAREALLRNYGRGAGTARIAAVIKRAAAQQAQRKAAVARPGKDKLEEPFQAGG